MSDQNVPPTDELYAASYYAVNFGIPYERNDHWLTFFGNAADRIVAAVQPSTALDVGCAHGFLVESLRDRGVDAKGNDISAYAISQVGGSAAGHCEVATALEPLQSRYDLISCIEVVEHLTPADGRQALRNMCQATDHLLLSTTPHDHAEPTHLNVQPPEYWAEILAEFNMFRDVDHDTSYLTPWAGLFVRREQPVTQLVKDYERSDARLREEVVALRQAVLEHHARIEGLTTASAPMVAELQSQLAAARAETDAAARSLREAAGLKAEIAHMSNNVHYLTDLLEVAQSEKGSGATTQRRLEADLDRLSAEAAAAKQRVVDLENSKSWKIGRAVLAPYRKIVRRM